MYQPANDNPAAQPYPRPSQACRGGILPGLKAWHVAVYLTCLPLIVIAVGAYAVALAWQEWRHPRRPNTRA